MVSEIEYAMRAPAQGNDAVTIDAPPEVVWSILVDATRLPEWMPIVTATTGRTEALGAERHCEIEMGRTGGQVHERCVVFDAPVRIGWSLVADTLGFSKMLADFSFDFVLQPSDGGTRLINTTYYRPKGWLARMVSAVVLKRKFGHVRRQALTNLARMAAAAVA